MAQSNFNPPSGFPRKEDPLIQRYLAGRQALIAQEQQQRTDRAFRYALSGTALEACRIVAAIREEEQRTLWTPELEDRLEQDKHINIYPGMMFSLAKDRVEASTLWKIVTRMPKGALLHAHFGALIEIDWLIGQLLSTPGMHMRSPEPLASAAALDKARVEFTFSRGADRRPPHDEHGASIWTAQYTPSSLVLLTEAADRFPDGGRAGFCAWLRERCTITSAESLEHHQGPNAVWQKFASIFAILASVIYYEPIFRSSIRHVCARLLADGVRWLEVRDAFTFQYRRQDADTQDPDYLEAIRVWDEEIEKFKASDEGQGFWGARIIWTTMRNFDTQGIITSMEQCIAVKKAYPHMISGFDLVGQEDRGRSLVDMTPELFWFRKRCAEEDVEIPFFFHAGEGLGDGDETDNNLFDALLLGTRRLGHGFSLFKHPLLIEMVKEKKVLIESCPISNEVLRLTSSITSHPLPALLARGVPVALCNDDPAILGQETTGLSHDYWQALQGWRNLGLEGLGALAENSVRWAAFEDQTAAQWNHDIKMASVGNGIRAARMQEWLVEWERFCQWIVDEFGTEESSLE